MHTAKTLPKLYEMRKVVLGYEFWYTYILTIYKKSGT